MMQRLLVLAALVGSVGCQSTASAVKPSEGATAASASGEMDHDSDAHNHGPIGPNQGSIRVERRLAMKCGDMPESHFAYDSAELTSVDPRLDRLARCLNTGALEGKSVKLIGHTDPRGSANYNLELGRERAQSVANYLSQKGVQTSRLVVDSSGEKDATPEPEGWAGDRVVDVKLVE